MGRWQEKIANKQQTITEAKQKGFHEVEQIDLAEGWRQIIAGQWHGIGLLDVQDENTQVFGRQVLIVESGMDRRRLQEEYPQTMMFTPDEFWNLIERWPESESIIRVKRVFGGDVVSVAS